MRSSSSWSFARCGGCEEDPTSMWTLENILQCQKVSDFLIALAYFSIPLELFYFVTCSAIFPFRWLILQFGAFIVLCGLTHVVAALSYAPHSFLLLLSLVVLKLLTAIVSLTTAVTLLPIIPQLLCLFVRDGLLRQKARDLGHDLGRMRLQEAATYRIRLLTVEIRLSLDRRTILTPPLSTLPTPFPSTTAPSGCPPPPIPSSLPTTSIAIVSTTTMTKQFRSPPPTPTSLRSSHERRP